MDKYAEAKGLYDQKELNLAELWVNAGGSVYMLENGVISRTMPTDVSIYANKRTFCRGLMTSYSKKTNRILLIALLFLFFTGRDIKPHITRHVRFFEFFAGTLLFLFLFFFHLLFLG